MLDAASKKALTDLGFDVDALSTAITSTAETPYKITLKTGEIKLSDTATIHVYDTDSHNAMKGRVKDETIKQATELGVKAVATAFDVDYKGNDPVKLKEAVVAKLNIPVDERIKEKDRDIATMTANWNKEKTDREAIALRLKDREETDRDIAYFPDNRIKSVKDKTLRMELKDEGITFGEHEGKPAVYVNGEVKKNADLTLVDPKAFTAEHFKTKGWIQEAQQQQQTTKRSLDVRTGNKGDKPDFDAEGTRVAINDKYGGKWTPKAQAEYTQAMLDHNTPPAQA